MADAEPKGKNIAIRPDVHKRFAAACNTRAVGRKMQDAASRLLDWFSRQPPLVQTAIMADVDEGMEPFYADALEGLADELRAKVTRDKSGRITSVEFPEEIERNRGGVRSEKGKLTKIPPPKKGS